MKIAGYLPNYRIATTDTSVGRYLDDLIYFNLRVDSSANLDRTAISETGIAEVMSIKERYGIPVRIGLAGWWTTTGTAFAPVMTNDSLRAVLIQNLVDFCLEYGFDGVDFDWEYPQTEEEREAYADLLVESREAFEPYDWKISLAVNSTIFYSKRAYDAIDQIHIMSYGDYQSAISTADIYMAMDIPKNKIFMGTPFFGRSDERAWPYREIMSTYHPGPEFNFIEGISYQGPYVQERRVQYADAHELGGIMIWEVGQDATDESSLLKTIHNAVRAVEKMPAPESMSAVPIGVPGEVRVTFKSISGAASHRLYYGSSHHLLTDSVDTGDTTCVIQTGNSDWVYFFQVAGLDSAGRPGIHSKIMASSTYTRYKNALIVNNYDAWRKPLHLIQHHSNLFWMHGYAVSSVYGESICDNNNISDSYDIVDYVAGDRGHYSPALSGCDIHFLGTHLESGGNLIISGSNIGCDLYQNGSVAEKTFYLKYLNAIYKDDAPNGTISQNYTILPEDGSIFRNMGTVSFDDGGQNIYNVFDPDVIYPWGSGEVGLNFADMEGNVRGACIYSDAFKKDNDSTGHVAYFSVPLETIYPESSREALFNAFIDYMYGVTAMPEYSDTPESGILVRYYPNPFNSQTVIEFTTEVKGSAELLIYNTLGQKVHSYTWENLGPGQHRHTWDAGHLPGGMYVFRIKTGAVIHSGRLLYIR